MPPPCIARYSRLHHGDLVTPNQRMLLDRGADCNLKSPFFGGGALHEAAQRGAVAVAHMLLEAGADVNVTANNGETPLIRAASRRYGAVLQLLLEIGRCLCILLYMGMVPLHSTGKVPWCKYSLPMAQTSISKIRRGPRRCILPWGGC